MKEDTSFLSDVLIIVKRGSVQILVFCANCTVPSTAPYHHTIATGITAQNTGLPMQDSIFLYEIRRHYLTRSFLYFSIDICNLLLLSLSFLANLVINSLLGIFHLLSFKLCRLIQQVILPTIKLESLKQHDRQYDEDRVS